MKDSVRTPWMVATLAAVALLASTGIIVSAGDAQAPAAPGGIVRVAKFATGVGNMEKTVGFYRDAFGIELRPGSKLGAPSALNAQLQAFVNAPPGTTFRPAFLTMPGIGGFDYELTEFVGPPRPSRVPRIQDPGASVLMLSVIDVAAVVANVRKAGGTVVSPGDGIVVDSPTRASLVQDPDGAFVVVVQPAWAAVETDVVRRPVTLARFGFVVADAEKAAAFYRERLGLQRWSPETGAQAWGFHPSLSELAGLKSPTQVASVILKEGTTPIDFFSLPQAGGTPFVRTNLDPGVPVVGLEVTNAAAATGAITAGGGTVVSGGGKGVPGMNLVFARDPSGVLVEVIQVAAR